MIELMTRCACVAVLASLLAGCGGAAQKSGHPAAASTPHATPALGGAPGRLAAIGGGRSLFVHCVGSTGPTVVLEAGFGGNTHDWDAVQPQLGRTARTCSYDRAGLGSSIALPGVHDARSEIDDLAHLLARAHIPPPYVLVGHSYGGLLARLYARAHPQDVAGIVLVDSMGRDQTRRVLAVWPRTEARALRRSVAAPVREGVDLAAGEALGAHIASLDDTRLMVVTAGTHEAEWGQVPARLGRALDRQWSAMQDELARLSGDHVHVVALRSDHFVQGGDGQPEVVVRAVRTVVRAARARGPLPPCPRVFGGPGVRCRR
jgi:pimeloyl-ACP methyl ester carboxylesterase